jgi:hypothetical protein
MQPVISYNYGSYVNISVVNNTIVITLEVNCKGKINQYMSTSGSLRAQDMMII